MPLHFERNDIINVKADAIVNTANPKPVIGSGTDQRIYKKAGMEQLLEERMKIGEIMVGEAAITPAFNLDAQYIIHTVGPVWHNGFHREYKKLENCYRNSLELAKQYGCKSIAFPLLATGNNSFPKDKALAIATSTINKFLLENEMTVTIVVYDAESFKISSKLIQDIDEYINDNYVDLHRDFSPRMRPSRMEEPAFYMPSMKMESMAYYEEEFDEDFEFNVEKTFQQVLFEHIDASKMTNAEVYKAANMDRRLFSNIQKNVDYHPGKNTVFALSIALKLNVEQTNDLLNRAGYSFSPSNLSDVIVKYFIQHKKYDVLLLNEVLFEKTGKDLSKGG